MSTSLIEKSGFASVGTHQLFYKIQGSGPRLLIITGTNSDTHLKPSIYDAPSADMFELVNFDHRGMGQSSSPDEAPDMAAYADDVAHLLDDLGWQETAVIGVSFGGMVAQHFTLRHPSRVRKLVLCCTSSGGDGGSSYPLQTLQDLSAEDYAATTMKLMNAKHTDSWQAEHPALARKVYDFYWKGADASFNNPDKFAAMKLQFAARAQHNVFEQLKSLNVPTLVAYGEEDRIALPANAKALAGAIPDAKLAGFKGGHMFLREDAKAWPTVFGFLKNGDNK